MQMMNDVRATIPENWEKEEEPTWMWRHSARPVSWLRFEMNVRCQKIPYGTYLLTRVQYLQVFTNYYRRPLNFQTLLYEIWNAWINGRRLPYNIHSHRSVVSICVSTEEAKGAIISQYLTSIYPILDVYTYHYFNGVKILSWVTNDVDGMCILSQVHSFLLSHPHSYAADAGACVISWRAGDLFESTLRGIHTNTSYYDFVR